MTYEIVHRYEPVTLRRFSCYTGQYTTLPGGFLPEAFVVRVDSPERCSFRGVPGIVRVRRTLKVNETPTAGLCC